MVLFPVIREVAVMRYSDIQFVRFCILFSGVAAYVGPNVPVVFGQQSPTETDLPGHTRGILDLAFSPNGRILGSASRDASAKLWNWKAGETLAEFRQHRGQSSIYAVAFVPGRQLLVEASTESTLRLWDLSGKKKPTVLDTQMRGGVTCITVSADGSLLAAAGWSKTVQVWDIDKRQIKAQFDIPLEGDFIRSLALPANGESLAMTTRAGQAMLWNIKTREQRMTRKGLLAAFSLDSSKLALLDGRSGTVSIWDVAAKPVGRKLRFPAADDVDLLAFTAEDVLFVHANDELRIWSADGHLKKTISVGESARSVSHDGKFLLTTTRPDQKTPNEVHMWSTETGKRVDEFSCQFDENVFALAFSLDSKRFAVAGHETLSDEGHTIRAWDTATKVELDTIKPPAVPMDVKAIAFSEDGKLVATGGADMCVRIANASDGRELHTLRGHHSDISCVAFSPVDRTVIASCGYDKTIRLWDSRTERCIKTLSGHNGVVRSVAFSPKGRRIASSGGSGPVGGPIKIWDATSGRCLKTFGGRDERTPWSVCFSPDGTMLVTAGRQIVVWDATTYKKLRVLDEPDDEGFDVAFSKDGDLVASGGKGGKITVWNVGNWTVRKVVDTVRTPVRCLAFSKRGTRNVLAAPSRDGGIKVWEF